MLLHCTLACCDSFGCVIIYMEVFIDLNGCIAGHGCIHFMRAVFLVNTHHLCDSQLRVILILWHKGTRHVHQFLMQQG